LSEALGARPLDSEASLELAKAPAAALAAAGDIRVHRSYRRALAHEFVARADAARR